MRKATSKESEVIGRIETLPTSALPELNAKVGFSAGFKVQLRQFEPMELSAWLERTVKPFETLAEAQENVMKEVVSSLEAKAKEAKERIEKLIEEMFADLSDGEGE